MKRSYGQGLDLLKVSTLMRHCLSFNKSVPYEIIRKEFERLENRVQGWSQRALVGTFMGGLKLEIAEAIR